MKFSYYYILLFVTSILSFSLNSFAQSKDFDQYYSEYFAAKENKDTSTYTKLIQAYNALEKNHPLGSKPGEIYFFYGNYLYTQGQYSESLESFFHAEKNFRSDNNECRIKSTMFNIGNVLSVLGNNDLAIEYLLGAKKMNTCPESGASEKHHFYDLGILFGSIGLHEDALYHFEKALDASIRDDEDKEIHYLSMLGASYEKFHLGQVDEAIETHLSVLEDTFSANYPEELLYYGYSELGDFYLEKNKLDAAQHCYKVARAIEKVVYEDEYLLMDLLNSANLNLHSGEYQTAIDSASKAVTLASKIGNSKKKRKAIQHLIEGYEKTGRWELAYRHSALLSNLKDSIRAKQTKNNFLLSELESSYQNEAELKSEIKESNIVLDKLNTMLVILGIASLFILAVALNTMHNKRRKELLNEKLEAANANKEKILRTLTHDIRTPLADLDNVLDLFEMDSLSVVDRKKIVNSIKLKVDYLRVNVDSILQWSIDQIKGSKAVKKNVPVVDIINNSITFLNSQALRKNIHIEQNIVNYSLEIFVDPTQMLIAVRNLLNNAIKYSPNNSKVQIKLEETRRHIRLSIIDSGKGLTQEQIHLILQDKISNKEISKESAGVGLKLVREYLSLNNANLEITSERNQGACFTIVLPK